MISVRIRIEDQYGPKKVVFAAVSALPQIGHTVEFNSDGRYEVVAVNWELSSAEDSIVYSGQPLVTVRPVGLVEAS